MQHRFPLARLTLALSASLALATSYHVDPDSGSDLRTAPQAASPATPWKTLAKASTASLAPGDQILLKAGGIWRERLRLSVSGTAEAPLVVGSYGSGPLPEIRGTISLTGTSANGIRSAKIQDGRPVKGVFWHGTALPVARFPRDTGWFLVRRGTSDSSVVASDLAAFDATGASLHLRTTPWTLETHRIQGSNSGEATLSEKPVYALDSSYAFVSNHPSLLKAPGTWAYSASDSTLRWIDPLAGPAIEVEAAVMDTGIDVSKASHIRIEGVRVWGTTTLGIHGNGSDGIEVIGCQVASPGLVAIRLNGNRNSVAQNLVEGATSAGIINHGAGNRTEANRIRNISVLAALGPDGTGPGCCNGHGIAVSGDSSHVSNNDIDSVGYNGITFTGLNSVVEANLISHYCITTEDGGGIYTIAGSPTAPGATGSVIRHNLILPTGGAASGRSSPGQEYAGIALDNNSHDLRIDSNVVQGSARGIGCHIPRRVSARGNLLVDNLSAQVDFYLNSSITEEDLETNSFVENTLVSYTGQAALKTPADRFATAWKQFLSTWDCREMSSRARCSQGGRLTWERVRLSSSDPFLGPERMGPTLPSAWSTTGVLVADTVANPLERIPVLRVEGTPNAGTASPLARFGVADRRWWNLSFAARGSRVNQPLGPVLQTAKGAVRLASLPVERLDTVPLRFDVLFATTGGDSSAVLQFTTGSGFPAYWIGGVSLREIQESRRATLGRARLFTNPTRQESHLRLPDGNWIDVQGAPLSEVVLPPLGGVVAFPADGTTALRPHGPRAADSGIQAHRSANGWHILGLREPALVFDLQGRTVARLLPDPSGETLWRTSRTGGVFWVGTGRTKLKLVAP